MFYLLFFNFHNREQFKHFVVVRPFWIKNIPTSYMLVKSPKTLFVKNVFVVRQLSTVFTVSAVKTSLQDFHFNFFYRKFCMLPICKIADDWIFFCIVIFPIWREHYLKISCPTVCKLGCFSSNCYRWNYFAVFFNFYIFFYAGKSVFILNSVNCSLGGQCLIFTFFWN